MLANKHFEARAVSQGEFEALRRSEAMKSSVTEQLMRIEAKRKLSPSG